MTKESDFDEALFQAWYTRHAKKQGLAKDPDDPKHFYNYRAAYKAGVGPDSKGHWPSKYKKEGHPRIMVDGVNTKTGKKVKNLKAESRKAPLPRYK